MSRSKNEGGANANLHKWMIMMGYGYMAALTANDHCRLQKQTAQDAGIASRAQVSHLKWMWQANT